MKAEFFHYSRKNNEKAPGVLDWNQILVRTHSVQFICRQGGIEMLMCVCKMHNLIPIVRKYQTNPNSGTFYKITEQYI